MATRGVTYVVPSHGAFTCGKIWNAAVTVADAGSAVKAFTPFMSSVHFGTAVPPFSIMLPDASATRRMCLVTVGEPPAPPVLEPPPGPPDETPPAPPKPPAPAWPPFPTPPAPTARFAHVPALQFWFAPQSESTRHWTHTPAAVSHRRPSGVHVRSETHFFRHRFATHELSAAQSPLLTHSKHRPRAVSQICPFGHPSEFTHVV